MYTFHNKNHSTRESRKYIKISCTTVSFSFLKFYSTCVFKQHVYNYILYLDILESNAMLKKKTNYYSAVQFYYTYIIQAQTWPISFACISIYSIYKTRINIETIKKKKKLNFDFSYQKVQTGIRWLGSRESKLSRNRWTILW